MPSLHKFGPLISFIVGAGVEKKIYFTTVLKHNSFPKLNRAQPQSVLVVQLAAEEASPKAKEQLGCTWASWSR